MEIKGTFICKITNVDNQSMLKISNNKIENFKHFRINFSGLENQINETNCK